MHLLVNMKYVLPLVFILGIGSVVCEYDVGRCVDILTSALTTNSVCDAMKIYMKCIVKEMNLHNLGLTEEALNIIQAQMDAEFAKQGVTGCYLDIPGIVEQVRQEENGGAAGTTRTPPTFGTATTLGDCITALTSEGIKSGGITCGLAREYTKCAVRVLDFLASNPTSQDIQEFKTIMDAELSKQGLNCNLDVESILDELRAEQGGATVKPVTTDEPWKFDITDRDYSQCVEGLSNGGNDVCRTIKDVIKCVLRNTPEYQRLTTAQKLEMSNKLQQFFLQFGNLDCDLDMDALAAEVNSERDGANSPLHATFTAVLTTFTIFVVYIL